MLDSSILVTPAGYDPRGMTKTYPFAQKGDDCLTFFAVNSGVINSKPILTPRLHS